MNSSFRSIFFKNDLLYSMHFNRNIFNKSYCTSTNYYLRKIFLNNSKIISNINTNNYFAINKRNYCSALDIKDDNDKMVCKEINFDEIKREKVNEDRPEIKQDCFAIVHLSGKQEKLFSGDIILTEKLVGAEVGNIIRLDKVLLLGTRDNTIIGTPRIKNCYVLAEVQEQTKGEKIIIFKKKRRKGYQRKRGFRPHITVLRILSIHGDTQPTLKHQETNE